MTDFEAADFHRNFRKAVGRLQSFLPSRAGEVSPPGALPGSAPTWLLSHGWAPEVSGFSQRSPKARAGRSPGRAPSPALPVRAPERAAGPRGPGVCSSRTRPRLQHSRGRREHPPPRRGALSRAESQNVQGQLPSSEPGRLAVACEAVCRVPQPAGHTESH